MNIKFAKLCVLPSPVLAVCLVFLGFAATASSQPAANGGVEGRVLNLTNGSYLNNARITVEGGSVETFSDRTGQYRITNVPPGEITLKVFYTGLAERSVVVNVPAGRTVTQDISLSTGSSSANADEAIMLDQFVVDSHKDTDQKSIAINEQRFAPNLKSVVEANAFGDVTEGNVGEFLKYLPGVSLEYTSPDARQIILRGVNPIYTAVYVDGNRMASAASSGSNRFFELEQASINNVARVEVEFSRTPEFSADALGGSVNMISKTAFESNRLQFNYRTYLSANGDELATGRTPGPGADPSHHIKPGADFSLIDPVTKNFGVTLNVSDSTIFYPQHRSQPSWTPIAAVVANPLGIGTIANPFLKTYQEQDGPKNTQRQSVGATVDWKISPTDTLSIRPQWNYYEGFFGNRNINWNVQGTTNTVASLPTSYSPDATQGAAGAGNASWGTSFRRKFGTTFQVDTVYQHNGPVWTFDGGTSFSHASNHYHDVQDGHFENVGLSIKNLTVGFAGISQYDGVRPATIATTDAAGNPVDTFGNLGAYTLNSAGYNEADSTDLFKTARFNLKRDLGLPFPSTVKAGVQVQQETRDIRKPTGSYTFVGPDGVAGTADDLVSNYPSLIDQSYSTVSTPYGLPQTQYPSPYAIYSLFQAHPEYFVLNQAGAIANAVKASQWFQETIPAAYVMGDSRLDHNQLRLVYGIRFESTQDKAAGFLQNLNAAYQQDASGNPLRDVNGALIPLIGANGKPLTDSSNAAVLAQAQYADRALLSKTRYASGFPSIGATYNVLPTLVTRLSYSRAIGRPDLANIIPGSSLPDPSGATPYAVTVNNPSLKPEYSNNYDASIEYYFSRVGVLSASVYRKDFSNFFGTSTVPATADLLNSLGFSSDQVTYFTQNNGTVTSKFNVGSARVTGVQLDYKQSFDEILPIPGFGAFVSGYSTHLVGAPNADFTNFISKAFNTGVSYANRKITARLNFNYRGTQRYGLTTYTDSTGTKYNGYEYYKPRPQYDVDFEYRLTKNAGLFVVGRNITNVVQDDQRYTAEMPGYTHLFRREEFGAQYTVGIKGTF
jgi:iron complex outermembrane recepter protein